MGSVSKNSWRVALIYPPPRSQRWAVCPVTGGRVAGGFWTLWSPFQVERGCDESVRTGRKPSKRKASEVVGSETTRRPRAWLSRGQRGATARSWRPKRTHRCAAKRWLRCKSPPQTASTSGVAKWWFGQMGFGLSVISQGLSQRKKPVVREGNFIPAHEASLGDQCAVDTCRDQGHICCRARKCFVCGEIARHMLSEVFELRCGLMIFFA